MSSPKVEEQNPSCCLAMICKLTSVREAKVVLKFSIVEILSKTLRHRKMS